MPKAPVRIKALMPALSLMSALKTSAYVAVALRHILPATGAKVANAKPRLGTSSLWPSGRAVDNLALIKRTTSASVCYITRVVSRCD